MNMKKACLLMAIFAVSSCDTNTVNIQTEVNTENDDSNEFLQFIFKQIEMMGRKDQEEMNKTISQSHTELATALLRVAPVVTIRGNITDSVRRLTLTFTVTASSLDSDSEPGEDGRGRGGGGGLLTPLVTSVEPYVLGFAELVVSGVLSSVIGNFIEANALTQIV